MRGRKLAPVLAGLAVFLAACGGSSSANAPTTGSTIVFGAAVSLTGSQSKEGALTKQGYDLWLDWIKARGGIVVNNVKHPVEIKYEDDQSNANLSATLVQKLIPDEKANFILGPYGSAATASDAVVAERNGIPMVEANGAAQSIFSHGYKYTFGVLSPANKYLTGVIDMAATLSPKPTTIAMLNANDSFSLEVGKAVEAYATSKGMQVVFLPLGQRLRQGISGEIQQHAAPRLSRRRVDGRLPGLRESNRERGIAGSGQGARCAGQPRRHDFLRPDQVRQPWPQHLQANGRRADSEWNALHGLPSGCREWQAPISDAVLELALGRQSFRPS